VKGWIDAQAYVENLLSERVLILLIMEDFGSNIIEELFAILLCSYLLYLSGTCLYLDK